MLWSPFLMERMSFFVIGYSCFKVSKYDFALGQSPSLKYNKAKADGVKFFYFWGHSYEMFEYDPLWEQLEQKIRMITEDPDAEWANVIDVVE